MFYVVASDLTGISFHNSSLAYNIYNAWKSDSKIPKVLNLITAVAMTAHFLSFG